MGRKPPQDGSNNLRVSCPKGRQDDAARHDNRVILCLAFETDEKALRRIPLPGALTNATRARVQFHDGSPWLALGWSRRQ